MRRVGSEEELTLQLAHYLRFKHPDILFHFDFGSGTKLSMGQAVRQKQLNDRSWPDLFIAEPVEYGGRTMSGLFIELKREGTKLKKRDGWWASTHIADQAAALEWLAGAGYIAQFACGYEEATELIESYLAGSA